MSLHKLHRLDGHNVSLTASEAALSLLLTEAIMSLVLSEAVMSQLPGKAIVCLDLTEDAVSLLLYETA